jgi:hypothetical protein
VHGHRLTRNRHPRRDERQRRVGLAHPPSAEVGEARGVAPRVDVDGQPHAFAGQLDRRGVGVDDLAVPRVDHEDGGGRHVQHGGEPVSVVGAAVRARPVTVYAEHRGPAQCATR